MNDASTHPYDGMPNDGVCVCGKPLHDPVHPPSWKEAWFRSLRLQGRFTVVQNAGTQASERRQEGDRQP